MWAAAHAGTPIPTGGRGDQPPLTGPAVMESSPRTRAAEGTISSVLGAVTLAPRPAALLPCSLRTPRSTPPPRWRSTLPTTPSCQPKLPSAQACVERILVTQAVFKELLAAAAGALLHGLRPAEQRAVRTSVSPLAGDRSTGGDVSAGAPRGTASMPRRIRRVRVVADRVRMVCALICT